MLQSNGLSPDLINEFALIKDDDGYFFASKTLTYNPGVFLTIWSWLRLQRQWAESGKFNVCIYSPVASYSMGTCNAFLSIYTPQEQEKSFVTIAKANGYESFDISIYLEII